MGSVGQRTVAWAGGAAALLTVGLIAGEWARTRASRRAASGQPPCRVVIAGAGFGGLQAALCLAEQPGIDLTVIDEHNHNLFQPLLYQVATAALAPGDIASPIRGILSPTSRTRVLMERVDHVDTEARHVVCGSRMIPYDELILATGSQPSYFGHGDWAAAAPSLKTLEDALSLRRRILTAFEQADLATTVAERRRLLTFVLIGGGATGVEMAGAIAELSRDSTVRGQTRGLGDARILLVEGADRLLSSFAPDLSAHAAAALRTMGVTIRTGVEVTGIANGHVQLGAETVEAGTIIWTAGTEATPVASWLGVKAGHGGRVEVDSRLREGAHGVYVIGDAALALGKGGQPLPSLAPVAKQQGRYVARTILRRLRGLPPLGPFAYQDYGTLATIGRNKAVAEFGSVHVTGFPAWLIWAGAHIFFLISVRNRFMVAAQWAFAYVTHERGNRLLVGAADAAGKGSPAAVRQ